VNGVPHVLIVDTTGTIVFVGHPASRPKLDEDLTMLLEGKMPAGLGGPKADKEADSGEAGNEITDEKYNSLKAAFVEG